MPIFLFLLSLIGVILRLYNLDWGNPFYFHPDERNIASSITQLIFPNQMNPHFFAYGSFPIYLIYFTGFITNLFFKFQDLFIQSILISRFYSAFLSLLIIPSVYFIGKKLGNKHIGLITAIFCALSVGLIQFAHFGTFEMWFTFLGIWLFYFSLNLIKEIKLKTILIVGILFGLLMAVKISSLPLMVIPIMSILINHFSKKNSFKLLPYFIFPLISLIVFTITSPYVFLDFNSFKSSINYESSVAIGTLPVFYTGEFFNSIPILFQFTRIYPFLINPILTILFIPSFFFVLYLSLKKKNYLYLLLIACFLLLFLPQAFLFAKWTRYIVPTLPFVYLIIAIAIENFFKKSVLSIKYYVLCVLIVISFIFAVSYFITAFLKQDSRIEASLWAKKNIPSEAKIISEVYDMGIVPFNQYLQNISLFNFYDLDEIQAIKPQQTEYIILPSQRIFETRLSNKNKFPIGNAFYENLFTGKLAYQKIYETSCDIFCKITYLGDPVFSFEQTTNVFDRPTVFIFKR